MGAPAKPGRLTFMVYSLWLVCCPCLKDVDRLFNVITIIFLAVLA